MCAWDVYDVSGGVSVVGFNAATKDECVGLVSVED
jgi:hypothetical protein